MLLDTKDAPKLKVERVLGWDLLRGCSAFAVATYHLLMWQKLAEIHSLGFYAVYLFFVLSGASLVINYYFQFSQVWSLRLWGRFLFTRYWRLAPLFTLLVLLSLPWKLHQHGMTAELLLKLVANLGFVFGFGSPATQSMIVGGWSLGIEFIFYLLFPLFLLPLAWGQRAMAWVLGGLLALQWVWIAGTIAQDAQSIEALAAYHQVPAFAAYFFGGCAIGYLHLHRQWRLQVGAWLGCAVVAFAGVAMVLLNTSNPAATLFGWRASLLTGLCLFLVWWSNQIVVLGYLVKICKWFGDVTYGVYLIHPFVYFGFERLLLPRMSGVQLAIPQWQTGLLVGCCVLGITALLAYASERWFERPVRQWVAKRCL